MKTILLPTDFSTNSWHAIVYALAFCKHWNCTFYILNVQKQSEFILDDIMTAPLDSSIYNAIAKDNKEELERFKTRIEAFNTNTNYTFKALFSFNNLTDAMKQVVSSKAIDLIIMGTKGATGAKEALFGSNTLNTIRKVDCPVLTIPENFKFTAINNVLFTTENSEDFSKEGVNPLLHVLTAYKAKLNAVTIDFANLQNVPDNQQTKLKMLFGSHPFTYQSLKEIPYPMAISAITQLTDYNIHALFIKPKSFLERFIYGSVSQDISYNTTIPLLILRK